MVIKTKDMGNWFSSSEETPVYEEAQQLLTSVYDLLDAQRTELKVKDAVRVIKTCSPNLGPECSTGIN